jgi:hypothetical protein
MTSSISFARNRNHDATIESICTRCYLTVATCTSESDLRDHEDAHTCASEDLAHLTKYDDGNRLSRDRYKPTEASEELSPI